MFVIIAAPTSSRRRPRSRIIASSQEVLSQRLARHVSPRKHLLCRRAARSAVSAARAPFFPPLPETRSRNQKPLNGSLWGPRLWAEPTAASATATAAAAATSLLMPPNKLRSRRGGAGSLDSLRSVTSRSVNEPVLRVGPLKWGGGGESTFVAIWCDRVREIVLLCYFTCT